MGRIRVCSNCREPLVYTQEHKVIKYCARCAPYVYRMRRVAVSRTTRWGVVSKACSSCGKIFAISEFRQKRNDRGYLKRVSACRGCDTRERKLHRERERGLQRDLSASEWIKTLGAFGGRCAYCGGAWEDREHLIPVVMGGGYTRMNIVPSCKRCNLRKMRKSPLAFAGAPEAFMVLLEAHS